MRQPLAFALTLAAGVVTLASVGWLAYRVFEHSRMATAGVPSSVSSSRQGEIGQAAADAVMQWVLPDLEGGQQGLAQWRGKVLVVNFWASWCAPCVEEMPSFSRLHERYAGQGVQFVGVGMDDTDNLRAFLRNRPVSYPVLVMAPMGVDTPALPINGLPLTLVIDRDGRLDMSRLGRLDEARLESVLRRLLTP